MTAVTELLNAEWRITDSRNRGKSLRELEFKVGLLVVKNLYARQPDVLIVISSPFHSERS